MVGSMPMSKDRASFVNPKIKSFLQSNEGLEASLNKTINKIKEQQRRIEKKAPAELEELKEQEERQRREEEERLKKEEEERLEMERRAEQHRLQALMLAEEVRTPRDRKTTRQAEDDIEDDVVMEDIKPKKSKRRKKDRE